MITSKQRAYLRSLSTSIPTIMQIGKGGISENLIKTVSDALEARELIKMRVLENSPLTAREAAFRLAEDTNSESVQIIGTRFVLYRRNKDKAQYDEILRK